MLVFCAGIAQTNAAKLHVCLSQFTKYWPNNEAKIYAHLWGATGADVLMEKEVLFGNIWYSCELNGNTNAMLCRMNPEYTSGDLFQNNNQYVWNKTTDITGLSNNDIYLTIVDNNRADHLLDWELVDKPSEWNGINFRGNINNSWNEKTFNFTRGGDGYTFTYSLTKSQIEAFGDLTSQGIRFRIGQEGDVCFNFATGKNARYILMYPNANGESLSLPGSTTPYYVEGDFNTTFYWQITPPTYDYTEIVITAKYVETTAPEGNWQISADAYLPAVTTNAYGYCTYVNPVAVTIPDGVTAYYATDDGDGSATAHAFTNTNPAANTPMLIKGAESTSYSFAVAASGTAPESNAFKPGTSTTANGLATGTGPFNYILNGNAFYRASGKKVAEGKAYLQLSKPAISRALVFPGEDETGINVVTTSVEKTNATYNLSGQRVATPSKGLYIVGGRKVIMK